MPESKNGCTAAQMFSFWTEQRGFCGETRVVSPWEPCMMHAIALSRNGFGHTAPNPCVGAVLVRDGEIVAEGWHAVCGGDHAERMALKNAALKGIDPATCTLVVTLEPCTHHGKTPPCTDAILEAGIRHVVIGSLDPNPQAGGGVEVLRSKGVHVETGVAAQACLDNIADFICWQNTARPYVILKLASTLDGKIATRSGHSRWVTGPKALRCVHDLRSRVQAVIIGGNTFNQDNPRLTCRDESGDEALGKQPLAVVATSRLQDSVFASYLVSSRPGETIFWTTAAVAASPRAEQLRKLGVSVESVKSIAASMNEEEQSVPRTVNLDLESGLCDLRQNRGVYYAMCEGGGKIALKMLEAGLVDELHLHLSPKILGDPAAVSLFGGRSPASMDEAMKLRFVQVRPCGEDMVVVLRPRLADIADGSQKSALFSELAGE